MYGFVHRKDIITSMTKAYENSEILLPSGTYEVPKGSYIATNLDGDQICISEEYVAAMKQIKVVTNPTLHKKQSPFVQEHIKHMMSACDLQQEESELWGK